ncbi:MAG: GTP-binding protein [Clostridia bacterium]
MDSLPVILITGFLGAGKTTFLNALLRHLHGCGKRTAMLINEFGRIGIDRQLVDDRGDAVYEVNQGSIFCACTRDQFVSALDSMASRRPDIDIALIESTGIGNTGDLRKYLDTPPLQGRIDVKQNFCLVDAANFHKVLETLPAVRTQVEEASVCVVNKTDLVSEEHLSSLEKKLKEINPDAPLARCLHGELDFNVWLDFSKSWSARSPLAQTPPEDISSVTLTSTVPMDKEKVRVFLQGLSHALLRVKGFLVTTEGTLYMEWVGGGLLIRPELKCYEGISRLVVIGHRLDAQGLKKGFHACRSNGLT